MPAAIACLQQIEAEVATEEARAQQNEAGRANHFGIAQADGSTIHVGPRFPLQDWHHCMILARAFCVFLFSYLVYVSEEKHMVLKNLHYYIHIYEV